MPMPPELFDADAADAALGAAKLPASSVKTTTEARTPNGLRPLTYATELVIVAV